MSNEFTQGKCDGCGESVTLLKGLCVDCHGRDDGPHYISDHDKQEWLDADNAWETR